MENKFNDYCGWTKYVYERTVSGNITEEELLEELIVFFKAGQGLENRKGIFWGEHLDDVKNMPLDAFCELVGEPTHRVAALMMYGWSQYKSVRKFTPLKEALNGALTGALECGFFGQGYEAEEIFEKNMKIYEDLKAYLFVRDYHMINSKFTETYVKRCGEFYIMRKCNEERR